MTVVWKRPSLTALELLWRWVLGAPLIALVAWKYGASLIEYAAHISGAVQLMELGGSILGTLHAMALRGLVGLLSLLVIWVALAGLGRGAVLHRLDKGLRKRYGTLVVLALLRVLGLAAILVSWFLILGKAWHALISERNAERADPHYVLAFAVAVCSALLLFVVWCLVSWVVRLAPVVAMDQSLGPFGSLRATLGIGALRSKLIEINLVMGIVKVALVVLAMVFSASPLPFESVATQSFLTWWWSGVIVLYFVASDYFHVVRAAAYLALYREYDSRGDGMSRRVEPAS